MDGTWPAALAAVQNSLASLWALRHGVASGGIGEVWQWYKLTDALGSAVAVSLLLAVVVYLLSLPTNHHSWVDKIWSIIPVYYAWHFALHDLLVYPNEIVHPRLVSIATLITVWGTRLTWNFWRKGGYTMEGEDYRWPIVRDAVSPALFHIFNIVFISLFQNLLLLGIVAPAYVAWQQRSVPFGPLDAAATMLCIFFLVFEAVADEQQWIFQTAKHAQLADKKRLTGEYAKGFLTSGLWEYSRHPNFFAEQSFWWSIYLFSVSASGQWLNWSIVGPVCLTLLFQGSTVLTESISASKYSAYKDYQKTVSRIIPWIPSAPPAKKRGVRPRKAQPVVAEEDEEQDEAGPASPAAATVAEPATEATPSPAKTPATRRTRAARAEPTTVRSSMRLRARAEAAAASRAAQS